MSYQLFSIKKLLKKILRNFLLGVIRHDFILVSGDVISNMSLEKVLAEHK